MLVLGRVFRAHYVTVGVANSSCVVLAAHPEDAIFGCGGIIMRKLAAGAAVCVIVFTDEGRCTTTGSLKAAAQGTPGVGGRRHTNSISAFEELGVGARALTFWEVQDEQLTERAPDLVVRLRLELYRLAPAQVFVTASSDPNPQHAALGRIARLATRQAGAIRLFEYPVWQSGSSGGWFAGEADGRGQRVQRPVWRRSNRVEVSHWAAGKRRALATLGQERLTGLVGGWEFLYPALQPRGVSRHKKATAEAWSRLAGRPDN